jgi:hypothetical protein
MKRALFFLLAVAAGALSLPAKEHRLEIKGDYLLYSYDFNYIYGQGNIHIKSKKWTTQAGLVEIDVANRVALASRDCQVESDKQKYSADVLEIDLDTLDMRLTTFKEDIRSWTLTQAQGASADKGAAAGKTLARRDHEALKKSLVYFLNHRIVITSSYRVYGYESTAFIEGVQSLSFKSFKLDEGAGETNIQGAGLDRIWYYPSQGLVVNGHLTYEKPLKTGAVKTANAIDLKYDILNNAGVPPRGKIYFNSSSSLDLGKKNHVGLEANYITGNMGSAQLALHNQWTPSWSSEWAAEYSLTSTRQEELWLRLRSDLRNKVLGDLALSLGYEKQKQYQADVSLQNQALKNITISLQHSRSRLFLGEDSYDRLSNSAFSLAYTNRLFNMVADYSFHRDLLQDQSQGTPRFSLSATPFRLYHGLLHMNFSSTFMVNQLNLAGRRSDDRQADMTLSLQSETIRLGAGPSFSFSLAAEQLLEEQRLDQFTSLGYMFKCNQDIAGFAEFNFLYNYHTRRQTEAWLIQGSTSQDWSAVLRLKEGAKRVQGWVSVSYNTKTGNFTSGYLDCAVTLIKNWQFQTQMNYDFVFRNFSYDFYLIRHAGRLMVRASYRSLSRKFLLELLPN